MVKYFDKHGKQIFAGMTIRHDNGETEKIYVCGNSDKLENDLGINASNPDFYGEEDNENFIPCEFYPLYQFDTEEEWEIIEG
jgi:hypothetical protein